jgi:lipopolysaccharide/colanic/teichoic acid biosynthesis glycosyltransferase
MLVTLDERATADADLPLEQTLAAVAAATRETDVLGWWQRNAVIGAILADLDGFDGLRRCEIEARLRRALAARVDAETAGRVSIRFYVHSQPTPVSKEALRPDLSLLEAPPRRAQLYAGVKRGVDIAGSLTLLIALAPLCAVIAALVKLTSPGPVLFRQVRVGRAMKPFTMLKFRTMAVTADDAIHHEFVTRFIQAGNRVEKPGKNALFKITNDPRVTSIGRVLRKTSLDELPQLWNVLRGEMSLVGPRPPIPYEVEKYKSWHCRRLVDAKPGITGLWQVTGRSRTTFDDMVRLDIRYARTCSLSTDLKILLATPRAVLAGKGAC